MKLGFLEFSLNCLSAVLSLSFKSKNSRLCCRKNPGEKIRTIFVDYLNSRYESFLCPALHNTAIIIVKTALKRRVQQRAGSHITATASARLPFVAQQNPAMFIRVVPAV